LVGIMVCLALGWQKVRQDFVGMVYCCPSRAAEVIGIVSAASLWA